MALRKILYIEASMGMSGARVQKKKANGLHVFF
jgi:hypothetical protein